MLLNKLKKNSALVGLQFASLAMVLVCAQPQAQDLRPSIQFKIKPRLCILSEGEELCEDQLEISWSADTPRSLCLYQSDKRLPLRCWEDELRGNHRFPLVAANNVEFSLREIGDDLLLASREFEVVQDNQQFRRRRRNPWSFF